MSYKALPLNLPWDGGVSHAHDNPDDGVSPLSSTASQPGYKAYRPPSGPSYQPTITYNTSARLPTPPTHNPISWPGIFPSRTPSQTQSRSPVPSLGVRPQLTQPYEESLPWANQSTHFRTASTGSAAADYTSLYDDSSRPASKQYFRNPRHERAAWGSTGLFPWKGVGAMISVGLCKSIFPQHYSRILSISRPRTKKLTNRSNRLLHRTHLRNPHHTNILLASLHASHISLPS